MDFKHKSASVTINDRELVFETGKIGRQANGAVIVKLGETLLLTTACMASEPTPNADFIPLRIDYQEKFSSAGKTLGGFIKREGRPTERETLVSRLIDRPLRPLFEEGFTYEVQILSFVFSYDGENIPDVLAICGASAALAISDIPFFKPVGAVRVGMIDNKFIINPTVEQAAASKLDLILAGTADAILMIEGHCDFLTEEQILNAIDEGHHAIQKICDTIATLQKEAGKQKTLKPLFVVPQEAIEAVEQIAGPHLAQALAITEKKARGDALGKIKNDAIQNLVSITDPRFQEAQIKAAFKKVEERYMRQMILEKNVRYDGRSPTQIREIDIEQSLLPRAHGSSLFTRGETQALAVATLGGESMGMRYEDLNGDWTAKFYMQYFFPPFSVGEVSRVGAPGRREVGHGKLAERALKAVIPPHIEFPYTIRLESNITESNGSSSMASVCGGCLALMDAGVPVKRPVSGIAMGLILEGERFVILSDILGAEDALGDMDFKVAGDNEGITAFQMDIKIEGITPAIMRAALMQAKEGRIHILNKMLEACPQAKNEMSMYAPRIETIQVNTNKIALIIGPGGKTIRSIIEQTGVQIDINDSGLISIVSNDGAAMQKAKGIINGLVAEIVVGQVYQGKVTSVVPFGVFVEVLPGKEGLCHISELDSDRVSDIYEFIKEGDSIVVKVLEMNNKGQYRLSRRATL